jgi:DNA-binding MarR family transcriptional regulator
VDEALRLDAALTDLAKLYQFRSLDEPLYGGLTVSQSYTLRQLYFGGPAPMGALAAALGVQLSTMTGVVDQLERRELVERVDHPRDRRSVQVRLTAGGRRFYRKSHEAFLAHLQPLVAGRPAAELERIIGFLAEAAQAVRGWRERHDDP